VGRADHEGDLQTIGIVSQSKTTVLIEVKRHGQELIAVRSRTYGSRTTVYLHQLLCRRRNTLETELFGHEKGAFTGASYRKLGKFELANSGTLLLDEIGDMSLNMQVKLLRVMQEREFERVGGREKVRTDARIIGATNKPLQERVAQGAFREDLYYRLNVIHIVVPPLRERPEDIPLLVDYLLNKLNRELKKITAFRRALELLTACDWPGNIRQLENTLRRAVVHNQGDY
jgi:transcriptional regulator with GAF, ATPase, and Fis domain